MIRFDKAMSKRTFINNLLKAGLIERESRGWYTVPSRSDWGLYPVRILIWCFGKEVAPGRYIYKREKIEAMMQGSVEEDNA